MWHPVIETPDGRQVVVEDYRIDNQHFTRSIIIPPGGGRCGEILTINQQPVANARIWREMINQAQSGDLD